MCPKSGLVTLTRSATKGLMRQINSVSETEPPRRKNDKKRARPPHSCLLQGRGRARWEPALPRVLGAAPTASLAMSGWSSLGSQTRGSVGAQKS